MILAMKKNIWRAVIEVSFIIFLFYSNPLTWNLNVQVWVKRGVVWAIEDFTDTQSRLFNIGHEETNRGERHSKVNYELAARSRRSQGSLTF
jgi:hypothetical protein